MVVLPVPLKPSTQQTPPRMPRRKHLPTNTARSRRGVGATTYDETTCVAFSRFASAASLLRSARADHGANIWRSGRGAGPEQASSMRLSSPALTCSCNHALQSSWMGSWTSSVSPQARARPNTPQARAQATATRTATRSVESTSFSSKAQTSVAKPCVRLMSSSEGELVAVSEKGYAPPLSNQASTFDATASAASRGQYCCRQASTASFIEPCKCLPQNARARSIA